MNCQYFDICGVVDKYSYNKSVDQLKCAGLVHCCGQDGYRAQDHNTL